MSSLLAAALSLVALAAPASAATLLVNGSFEQNPGVASTSGANFANMPSGPGANWSNWASLPGWTSGANGIEVQTNRTLGTIDAFDGSYYVELDAARNTFIAQTVNLSAGTYRFSFRYSPRTTNAATNGVGFRFASATETAFDASAFGPNANLGFAVGTWSPIERTFTVANAGPFTLTLTGLGTSEGMGALVDDVELSAVPLPAGVVLMLTGLGALGVARRARKAA